MPNRNQEANYRYGYQGEYAEKVEMGGTHSFELRLWDARIGRWSSPDPLAEQTGHVYSGMNNNPVNLVDPDGRAAYPPFDGIDQYHDNDGWFFWDSDKGSYLHLTADDNGTYWQTGNYNSPGGLDLISGDYTIIHNGKGREINTSLPNLSVDSGGNFTYGLAPY